MPSKLYVKGLKAMLILFLITGCEFLSKSPPEQWSGRYILSYNEETGQHHGCTIEFEGEEYTATFEDFLSSDLFQRGTTVEWTDLGEQTWLLEVRKGRNAHELELQEVVTPMGNEGVDIVSWAYNGHYLQGDQKTANFHRLMDSKEWHAFQQAQRP